MPSIIPIGDLKDTARVSRMCHNSLEPVFITENGLGDMVLMSMEAYEARLSHEWVCRELAVSEAQIGTGRVRDAGEALAALREKYGI